MVRWWAAFFISGLMAPYGSAIALPAIGVSCGLAILVVFRDGARRRAACDPRRTQWLVRAVAYYLMTCSGGIVLAGAASGERLAHESAGIFVSSIRLPGAAGAGAPSERPPRVVTNPGGGIRSLALPGIRARLLASLEAGDLTRKSRGFVGALILDERSGLGAELGDTYSYLGITHFLALSGLHLGALAIPLAKALSLIIHSKRRRDGALLMVLAFYSAIAGFPSSLLRALFLSAAVIAYRFYGMHVDLLGALLLGSFVLAGLEPAIVFDAGFQLSFAAVCGIAAVGLPLSRMAEKRLPGGFPGTVLKALIFPAIITCAVQFFTLPLVVSLFGRSSLLSPLVNIIVSLPFTILLYAGFAYVFVPAGALRALLAPLINIICRFLEIVPGAFALRPHAGILRGDFQPAVYFLGAGLIALSLRGSCGRKGLVLAMGIAGVACSFVVPVSPRPATPFARPDSGAAEGNGVSIIERRGSICYAGRPCILFVGDAFTSRGAYHLTRELWRRGVRKIDCCIISSSTIKGSHGVYYLLERVKIEEVICSPYLPTREPRLRERLARQGIAVQTALAGDSFERGPWVLSVEAPRYPPPPGRGVTRAEAALRCSIAAAVGRGPLRDPKTGLSARSIDPDRVQNRALSVEFSRPR